MTQLSSSRAPREFTTVVVNRAVTESSSPLCFQMKSELKEVSFFSPVLLKFCYAIEYLQKILLWVSRPARKDLEAFNIQIFLLTRKDMPPSRENWLKLIQR